MINTEQEIGVMILIRLRHARSKHPEGTTFENLIDEFLECYVENKSNDLVRRNDEILDLIVCGIRILMKGDKRD